MPSGNAIDRKLDEAPDVNGWDLRKVMKQFAGAMANRYLCRRPLNVHDQDSFLIKRNPFNDPAVATVFPP